MEGRTGTTVETSWSMHRPSSAWHVGSSFGCMLNGDFDLPARPDQMRDWPVAVWSVPVPLPTYLPDPPDRYPAYLDRRVYQGSSGRVFPLPFHDRISEMRTTRQWVGLHLEN